MAIHEDAERIIEILGINENYDQYLEDRIKGEIFILAPYLKITDNNFTNNYVHKQVLEVKNMLNVEITGNRYANNIDNSSAVLISYDAWYLPENTITY